MKVLQEPAYAFKLPPELLAAQPPEAFGLRRDNVRLLVYDRYLDRLIHTRFERLPDFLRRGDILVLNDSRTIPASLQGAVGGQRVEIRLLHSEGNLWLCVIDAKPEANVGSKIIFSDGLTARLREYNPKTGLGHLQFSLTNSIFLNEVYRLGRPIQYEHVLPAWPIDYFQTIYAAHPGSVEMPSAGRPFTWELLFKLRQHGVRIAFITLHCGVSYINTDTEGILPLPEQYAVSREVAKVVNQGKKTQNRIIAVGTTVVRALESAVEEDGLLLPKKGWTALRINASHRLRIVDGLLTGFHEPESSHLEMIRAFTGPGKIAKIYLEAIRERYHWHEFGDANLIL